MLEPNLSIKMTRLSTSPYCRYQWEFSILPYPTPPLTIFCLPPTKAHFAYKHPNEGKTYNVEEYENELEIIVGKYLGTKN